MPDTTRRAAQIAAEVFERPADQRRTFLNEACGSNDALRTEVESLLVADAEAGSFMDHPAVRAERTADHDPLVGTTVDRFAILRRIAVGGMGAVYEAEQVNPHRRVALKLVRPGAATPNALRRFEHEAHVLARLQHPGIAQIFDAGSFDTGQGTQPFFAMELIDGQPLTQYADARKLHTRQRLELFADICDAVHYAHLKGVIHRDLKPGNVLVDADGHPKVLDFGVARVTDADVQTTTLHTQTGELLGTLPYMSPEQVLGDAAAIDVRSDVYGLGVMLYELLAGKLPHDLQDKPVAEAARIIREDDVTPLSSVNRIFRGDLDTIVAKALDRDPDRRYTSAAELAADVRRYLHDEPITARPASALYQIRKFTRRHKAMMTGVAGVFVASVAGTAVATYGLVQANEQREAAEIESVSLVAINGFLAALLQSAQPERAQGREVSVREILEEASIRIESELAGQPVVEAAIRDTIGDTYRALGYYASAEPQLELALAIRRRVLGDDHPHTLDSINNTGMLLYEQDKLEEAEPYYHEALDGRRRVLGNDHHDTLQSINNLALLLQDRGRRAEAEPYYLESLEGHRRVLGDEHPSTLNAINNMGYSLQAQGKFAETEPYFREALEGRRRILGDEHPDTLQSINNMGYLLRMQSKLAEAEPYYLEALEGRRRVLGDDHRSTLNSIINMGALLLAQGKLAEAEAYLREAVDGCRRTLGNDHAVTLSAIGNMGGLLQARGQLEEAEPYFREALERRRRVQGTDHPRTLMSVSNMGELLRLQGKLSDAEAYCIEALDGRRRVLGDDHPRTLLSVHRMGDVLQSQGRLAEAEAYYREALDGRTRALGDGHRDTIRSKCDLALTLVALDDEVTAEGLCREALIAARESLGVEHWLCGYCQGALGRALLARARFEEAESALIDAHGLLAAALGTQHKRTMQVAGYVANLYFEWEVPEKAAEWTRLENP